MNPAAIRIKTEDDKRLTVGGELKLMRAAYAKAPSPVTRVMLANMLFLDDLLEETISLLEHAEDRSIDEERLLIDALLSRETAEANARAAASAQRVVDLVDQPRDRAAALAMRGKCEIRLGLTEKATKTLGQALALDPHNKDACKRITALELAAGRTDALLSLTERLLADGVGHARLFGARVLAHAKAGDFAAAREAEGFDQLHSCGQLAGPPGWASIHDFNAALAEELIAHPGIRYERYGSASVRTWRIENPMHPDAPLFRTLIEQIVAQLKELIADAGNIAHPWAKVAPTGLYLRNWCVITEGAGFESWHVHQFGWLSGVYYVRVPEEVAQGEGPGGCLAFGLPDDLIGAEASTRFGERLIRPREGMLMTFPSHVYHRTYPHGASSKRICVAFDLKPN
jgi:tetratricopeptide (TPR) repeat protein